MRQRRAFDIVGPDGRRATVVPRSEADTVGDLLAAIGDTTSTAVWVDGHRVTRGERLVDVPAMVVGARIECGSSADRHRVPPGCEAEGRVDPVVEVAVIAGPSCRSWTPLHPGRHTVGRSHHCSLRLVDPLAELHHGVFDVDPDGITRFTQLTGRVPVRLDGTPCDAAEPVVPGGVLQIGSSLLVLRRADHGRAGDAGMHRCSGSITPGSDPWRRVVRRGPVEDFAWGCPPVVAPQPAADHPSPPATGLVGAVVGVTGAVVVATVMRQPMFAVFSMIGGVASLITWIVGIAGALRRRRVARRGHVESVERFRSEVDAVIDRRAEHDRAAHRTIIESLEEIDRLGGRIWERRPPPGGPVRLTVGLGTSAWLPPVDGWDAMAPELTSELERRSTIDLHPAPVELRPGDGLAVHGELDTARAVARAIVLQLATWVGPADWQLLVVTGEPQRWEWASWLPHAMRADQSSGVVTPDRVEGAGALLAPDRMTVLVTDDAGVFDARTGPTRRLVAASRAIVVAAVGRERSVPSLCRQVLRLGSTGGAEWSPPPTTDRVVTGMHCCGLDEVTAAGAARRLASLTDPEDGASAASAIVHQLRFADLDRPEPGYADSPDPQHRGVDHVDHIVERWRSGGVDPAPCTPIGLSADGIVDLDLVRDGPHGLVAGTTGSGKSELLRTLVLGLATRCSPDHLTFVLVDYKGGSTFDACARLPHTVGLVTDLDEGGAARALVSLEAELRRRERALRAVDAADLTDYRGRSGVRPLPRLVVVVDEFAALAQELPGFLSALVGIAQRGRSLGVHLVLATQRPGGVVSDDIRANTNLRLALRLHDTADARDVVDDDLPATLPRGVAGRAVLRLGPGELLVFQAARCTGPVRRAVSELVVTVWHGVGHAGPVTAADGEGARTCPAGARGEPSELSEMVAAVRTAAARLGLAPPRAPWLEPLPAVLDPGAVDRVARAESTAGHPTTAAPDDPAPGPSTADDSTADASTADPSTPADSGHDAVGLIDDPDHQARRLLRWDAAGNLALIGPLGAGLTSTVVALVAALCRTRTPERLHVYVIDAVGDALLDGLEGVAHCGAVVRLRETERLDRLLLRLGELIDRRVTDAARAPQVVLAIDGYGALRTSMSSIERVETLAVLDRVVADGPAVGVCCLVTGSDLDRVEAAERWVFGHRGAGAPGRLRVGSSGLEAQVARGAPGLAALPDRTVGRGPAPVEVLPERIDHALLGPSWTTGTGPSAADHLVVGRSAADLADVALVVPDGDHVFVGGPSRSGKSVALRVLVTAWRALHPCGRVIEVERRRPLDVAAFDPVPTLVVVDDADRVDDPGLASLAAEHRSGVTLVAAARIEAVRTLYGHWTRDVARRRCGIVLTSAGEVDGDLLGATLPQRTAIPPRPGLAWLIDPVGRRLAQVASVGPVPVPGAQPGDSSPRR